MDYIILFYLDIVCGVLYNQDMDKNIKKDGFKSQKLIVLPRDLLDSINENKLTQNAFVTDIGFFPNAQYHYRERDDDCNSHIIIFCYGGKGFFSLNGGEKKIVSKGQILILPPNTPHSYGSFIDEPWSIYWMHISGKSVSELFGNLDNNSTLIDMSFSNQAKFIELFEEVYDNLEYNLNLQSPVYISKIVEHIIGLIFDSFNNSSCPTRTNNTVEKAISYMSQNLRKNITLEELCQYTGFSRPHLNNIFKNATGFSPVTYFLHLKIRNCCKYLDFTDLSIKEISDKFGFSDPYYFSRLFKKVMGVSPRTYRNTQKG